MAVSSYLPQITQDKSAGISDYRLGTYAQQEQLPLGGLFRFRQVTDGNKSFGNILHRVRLRREFGSAPTPEEVDMGVT